MILSSEVHTTLLLKFVSNQTKILLRDLLPQQQLQSHNRYLLNFHRWYIWQMMKALGPHLASQLHHNLSFARQFKVELLSLSTMSPIPSTLATKIILLCESLTKWITWSQTKTTRAKIWFKSKSQLPHASWQTLIERLSPSPDSSKTLAI